MNFKVFFKVNDQCKRLLVHYKIFFDESLVISLIYAKINPLKKPANFQDGCLTALSIRKTKPA